MIEALKKQCREDQVTYIEVGTSVENEAAQRTYEGTGARKDAICEKEVPGKPGELYVGAVRKRASDERSCRSERSRAGSTSGHQHSPRSNPACIRLRPSAQPTAKIESPKSARNSSSWRS